MRLKVLLAAITIAAPSFASAQPGRGTGATQIQTGEQCPAGMTEIRPRLCQAPTIPAPSILDYRPRSTLVAPVHMVAKAKYAAIDYHGHPEGRMDTAEGLAKLGDELDALNVRMMISADNSSGERLKRTVDAIAASPKMKDRARVLAGVNFNGVGSAGWAEKAVAQLETDVKNGAVGIGEIPKSLGLSYKKADGSRLKIDDPDLDPVWNAAARLKIPVFIHTADPEQFFEPLDYNNERWLEQALFPGRRYPLDRFPSFETVMTERDNMFRKQPKTTFVAAHLGWYAADLGKLGKLFDTMPNVNAEVGAVLYDIGRQPRAAHDFFIKYQDRLLFGKDSYQPEEYPYYWRVFETNDDYFDYYRGYHAFWKLYGIDLPDTVLRKLYYENALRITPSIPRDSWARK